MSKVNETQSFTLLSYGRTVPSWIHKATYKAAIGFIPYMPKNHRFPAESILGNHLWANPLFRCLAPYCLADMVRSKKLPLQFGDKGGKSTNMYQLL